MHDHSERRHEQHVISDAVLDELMFGYEKPEDLLTRNRLFTKLDQRLIMTGVPLVVQFGS